MSVFKDCYQLAYNLHTQGRSELDEPMFPSIDSICETANAFKEFTLETDMEVSDSLWCISMAIDYQLEKELVLSSGDDFDYHAFRDTPIILGVAGDIRLNVQK